MVALLFVGNYAYYIFSASTSFRWETPGPLLFFPSSFLLFLYAQLCGSKRTYLSTSVLTTVLPPHPLLPPPPLPVPSILTPYPCIAASEWMGYAGTADNDPGGCHCTGDWFGEGCKARVGRTKIYLPVGAPAMPCAALAEAESPPGG